MFFFFLLVTWTGFFETRTAMFGRLARFFIRHDVPLRRSHRRSVAHKKILEYGDWDLYCIRTFLSLVSRAVTSVKDKVDL
jgi:hypothetical protein